MNNFFKGLKALADASGGAGHQFEKTYNPAAKYGLQKPARDIALFGKPTAFKTDSKFLNVLNPNAFRPDADSNPPPMAPSVGSMLGKGGAGRERLRPPDFDDV